MTASSILEAEMCRIQLPWQENETLVRQPAEVFRLPAGAHDACVGVAGGV